MGKRIGIDLGTTNSVIAIGRDVPAEEGTDHRVGRVTVLGDEFGRTIHTSAICDCEGDLLFGDDGKAMVAEGYAPVRFWKRYMGKDIAFDLGTEEFLPEQLSSMWLGHLKRVAEQRLGEEVESAVITHPACFSAGAIATTRWAAEDAGLSIDEDGLLMDPIAAALAYLRDDPEPDKTVRVLVYDLGGGTFDVTVLQRSAGSFTPLSFDGDPELGGYNFDKALAAHILNHLQEQGYTINIDRDKPERDPRWASLMHIAEDAKVNKFGQEGPAGKKADIRNPRLFQDDEGRSVRLAITITREEFEEMIRPMVRTSIKCCRQALSKANLDIEQIDRAILVGGSSRLQIVQKMLADPDEGLGRPFEIDENMADLCVAVGAALFAGSDAPEEGNFRLEPIPTETDYRDLVVAGTVVGEEGMEPAGCMVNLSHNGQEESTIATDDGKFFLEVELVPKSENQFELTAQTADGSELARHTFSVTHSVGATETMRDGPKIDAVPSYLAKTIYVMTDSGLREVGPEGRPLPFDMHTDRLMTTGHEATEVPVKLYQGDLPLTDLVLSDFSPPAPRGSAVELTVHVGRDYKMSAEATIPCVGARDERENIQIPKPPRPEVAELESRFADLQARGSDFLQNLPPGDEKITIGTQTDEQIEEIQALLEDPAPDVFRIDRLLNNLDRYLKEGAQGSLEPSQQAMAELFARGRDAIAQAEETGAQVDGEKLNRTLEVLAERAAEARNDRNQKQWQRVATNLEEMAENLDRAIQARRQKRSSAGTQMPPPVLAMQLQALVMQLEEQARQKGRDADPDVQESLQRARQQLNAVDVNSPQAMPHLAAVYQGPIQRAMTLVEESSQDGVGLVSRKSPTTETDGSETSLDYQSRAHTDSADDAGRQVNERMPGAVTDSVAFSLTSPAAMTPGESYVMDVWAHLRSKRQLVLERAREEAAGKKIRIKSKGPVKVERGTVLSVRLEIDQLDVEPQQDTILWDGMIGNATFAVAVPSDIQETSPRGSASILVNGGEIAKLMFVIQIGRGERIPENLDYQETRYSTAFASYARADEDEVLPRLHGIMKGVPGLDLFFDQASLRSGQRWKDALRREILNRDVLYLFWSRAASESEWVDWEWRLGYDQKGIDFIDPVPLVSPEEVPPPPELAEKHFGDWLLAHMLVSRYRANEPE
jgi:molecular chaperone DnaK (HSP70)